MHKVLTQALITEKGVRITTPVDFLKINGPSLGRRGNLPNTYGQATNNGTGFPNFAPQFPLRLCVKFLHFTKK